MPGKDNHAHACCQVVAITAKRVSVDGAADVVDLLAQGRIILLQGQHNKLVATNTANNVICGKARADALRKFLNNSVASHMPQRIIEFLEVINVEHDHGKQPTVAFVLCKAFFDQVVGGHFVIEAGQAVFLRHFLQAEFKLFFFINVLAANNYVDRIVFCPAQHIAGFTIPDIVVFVRGVQKVAAQFVAVFFQRRAHGIWAECSHELCCVVWVDVF